MIERKGFGINQQIVLQCDACGEELAGEPGEDWSTFWPQAKRAGWKTEKINDRASRQEVWLHNCPTCA